MAKPGELALGVMPRIALGLLCPLIERDLTL